jgi:hypothetical protein
MTALTFILYIQNNFRHPAGTQFVKKTSSPFTDPQSITLLRNIFYISRTSDNH